MKFDKDVLKMMKKRKGMKKMKFSMNFWIWSPLWILFFDFDPYNFVSQHTKQHINVVFHITRHHVILRLPHRRFVTDDDGKDQNQNVYLQGLFRTKKWY